jgi:hypothetical protein
VRVFGLDKDLARYLLERTQNLDVANPAAAHGEQKLHPRFRVLAFEFPVSSVAVRHPRANSYVVISLSSNIAASLVMNGLSVRSIRSGVTEIFRFSIAERSLPSLKVRLMRWKPIQ